MTEIVGEETPISLVDHDNIIIRNCNTSITLSRTSNIKILNCTIHSIRIHNSDKIIFHNNFCTGEVEVKDNTNITISNNIITSTTFGIFCIGGADINITSNEIYGQDTTDFGLSVKNINNAVVMKNKVSWTNTNGDRADYKLVRGDGQFIQSNNSSVEYKDPKTVTCQEEYIPSIIIEPIITSSIQTRVSYRDSKFYINEVIINRGKRSEGLLLSLDASQAIFDDENKKTRKFWIYGDTYKWSPQRNTDEFIAQLSFYKSKGINAVTINLQGDNPSYSTAYIYANSTFAVDGSLKAAYLARLKKIILELNNLEMILVIDYFYGSQSTDKVAAIENITKWIQDNNFTNIVAAPSFKYITSSQIKDYHNSLKTQISFNFKNLAFKIVPINWKLLDISFDDRITRRRY